MQFPSSAAAHPMSAPAVSRPRLLLPGFTGLVSASLLLSRVRARAARGVAVRSGGQGSAAPPDSAAILRRPSAATTAADERESDADAASLGAPVEDEAPEDGRRRGPEREWVDWEDLILEDTVPLVGFVRMILHSGKYSSGDRLTPEHEKAILERLLPYHPQYEKKIGCGIDYITLGLHPEFENSRCLFIVRTDGVQVDFSFWKCIKGLIREKYPLYADSFILRHFRRRQDY